MKILKKWKLPHYNPHIYRFVLFLSLAFYSTTSIGQNKLLPLSFFSKSNFQQAFANVDSTVQTSFWPQLENQYPLDSVYGYTDNRKYYYSFTRKLLRDHLVIVKGKDYNFTFDLLFDFQLGYDFADTTSIDRKRIFNNTRGFIIQGDIGKKVSFYTSVYENQSRFPRAINLLIDSLGVIPGQGRVKPTIGKDIGYDYNASFGVLSVQPTSWLNLQFGHGKHFIGNGYRSMLLSDNSFNYPYLQANVLHKKWQYHFWYSKFLVLERMPLGAAPESLFKPKSGNFYYLNYLPNPRFELGLFESIIWKDWDNESGSESFEPKKLIPIIGVNSLLISQGYSRWGINAKIKLANWMGLYAQWENDTFAQGTQFGLLFYNLVAKNLNFQLEFNSSKNISDTIPAILTDYSHFNQPIAHPLGNDFEELIFIANYRYKRWFSQVKYVTQNQPLNHFKEILDFQTGYLLNPKTNMNFSLGYTNRNDISGTSIMKTQWIYFALRTSLWNKYYDY